MADINDNDPDFDHASNEDDPAEFEAMLAQKVALMPPELYDSMKQLLQMSSLANFMLLGHPDDPVPVALHELLDYKFETMQTVANVQDTPGLARVMAAHTLLLFDFIMVARLVFESSLEAALRASLTRGITTEADVFNDSREYVLHTSESLLENLVQYLASADDDIREELHMRRLQTESIFACLNDTLRPYYPLGHSPADDQAAVLDAADEVEDEQDPYVNITFNETQRQALSTALRLPWMLSGLAETPFGRALAGVGRFRKKALERLADRMVASEVEEPFALTWPELLRLYQAVQVCALSAVTDVMAAGSLEDSMAISAATNFESPEEVATFARQAREVMLAMMAGFVRVVEMNYPDDEEVAEAKAEISQLAELLME